MYWMFQESYSKYNDNYNHIQNCYLNLQKMRHSFIPNQTLHRFYAQFS
jgi:hypothetical protein